MPNSNKNVYLGPPETYPGKDLKTYPLYKDGNGGVKVNDKGDTILIRQPGYQNWEPYKK
jgi:hypothetical protein